MIHLNLLLNDGGFRLWCTTTSVGKRIKFIPPASFHFHDEYGVILMHPLSVNSQMKLELKYNNQNIECFK